MPESLAPKTIRAFISSTFVDLVAHRAAVRKVLEMMSVPQYAMEVYTSDEKAPLDKCLDDVRRSDLYIGIFAHRYGFVPSGRTKSITELEFREAGLVGIERFVFLLDDNAPWNLQFVDAHSNENERGERIRALREELKQTKTVLTFTSPEDLSAKVAASVHAWWESHRKDARVPAIPEDKIAARAPALAAYLSFCMSDMNDFAMHYIPLSARWLKVQSQLSALASGGLWPSAFRTLEFSVQSVATSVGTVGDAESILLSAARGARSLVTAEAGAGKTVLLRRLRLALADRVLNSNTGQIPLLINLPEWPSSIDDFRSLVVHERTIAGCPPVPEENLFLLLDGLDELPAERKLASVAKITTWLDVHPQTSCILALRKIASRQAYPFQASVLEIEPMGRSQIEEFISKRVPIEKYQALVAKLYRDQSAIDPSLSFSTRTPFNLALTCAVFNNTGSELPESLGQLIQHLVHALYQRESDVGTAIERDKVAFVTALAILAIGLNGRNVKTVMHADWVRKRVQRGLSFDSLCQIGASTGLLSLKKNGQVIVFYHSIFQQYFAALYVKEDKARINELLKPISPNDVGDFPDHIFGTILILLEIGEFDEVIATISRRNPHLALSLVNERTISLFRNSNHTIPLLLAGVRQRLDEHRADQVVVDRVIGVIANYFPQHMSILLSGTNPAVRRGAVAAYGRRILTSDSLQVLVGALRDSNRSVRREVRDILRLQLAADRAVFTRMAEELLLSERDDGQKQVIGTQLIDAVGTENSYVTARLIAAAKLDRDRYAALSSGDIKRAYATFGSEGLIGTLFAARSIVLDRRRNDSESTAGVNERMVDTEGDESQARVDVIVDIDKQIDDLGTVGSEAAVKVIQTLVRAGDAACIRLLRALQSNNEKVRRRAPRVFGALRFARAIPALLELLDDREDRVVLHALRALGLMREPSIAWVFEEFVGHSHANVALHALRGLDLSGSQETTEVALRFLRDVRSDVRGEAARIVLNHNKDAFRERVNELVHDEIPHIRHRALAFKISEEPIDGLALALEMLRDGTTARGVPASIITDVIVGAGAIRSGARDARRPHFDAEQASAVREYSEKNWRVICDSFVTALAAETTDSAKRDIAVAFFRFLDWTNTFDRFLSAIQYLR